MEVEVILGKRERPGGIATGKLPLRVAERPILPPLPAEHPADGEGDGHRERRTPPGRRAEEGTPAGGGGSDRRRK
jgi:hypothetical protein